MTVLEWVFDFLGLKQPSSKTVSLVALLATIVVTVPFGLLFHFSSRPRQQRIPAYRERVLILGASNEHGVGEALALQYVKRGCRDLILVGRNSQGLENVRQKCIIELLKAEQLNMSDHMPGDSAKTDPNKRIHTFAADCTSENDLDRLQKWMLANFKGLDTLHNCFGVSALLPLLGIAGVDPIRQPRGGIKTVYSDQNGLAAVKEAVTKAADTNLTGTAISLVALIPLLQTTSTSPAIALTSSAAALFPAPTRSIYACTKAAQLSLFRSMAIECQAHHEHSVVSNSDKPRAQIRFLAVCPGTIATSFRHSAVDLDPNSSELPKDLAWSKGEKMLTAEYVANKTIHGIDRYQQGVITLPALYAAAVWIEKIFPTFVQKQARKKYAY